MSTDAAVEVRAIVRATTAAPVHHFREDESAPWELVRRELAQIEQDKRQVEAALVAIDQRLAEQQMVVTQLAALETYCAQVSRQCERCDFDGKRLALEALDIQVTANGREWHLDGRIPVNDVRVVTPTSGRYGHNAFITFSFTKTSSGAGGHRC